MHNESDMLKRQREYMKYKDNVNIENSKLKVKFDNIKEELKEKYESDFLIHYLSGLNDEMPEIVNEDSFENSFKVILTIENIMDDQILKNNITLNQMINYLNTKSFDCHFFIMNAITFKYKKVAEVMLEDGWIHYFSSFRKYL